MLGNLKSPAVAVHIGTDLENADWPKSTVDLALNGRVVRTHDELLQVLREEGTSVEEFKRLPAYQAALMSGEYPWLVAL